MHRYSTCRRRVNDARASTATRTRLRHDTGTLVHWHNTPARTDPPPACPPARRSPIPNAANVDGEKRTALNAEMLTGVTGVVPPVASLR